MIHGSIFTIVKGNRQTSAGTFARGGMKHNPTDRLKDPFYAGLLFQIEQIICQADDAAKSQGLELTDSQVRSALIKAKKKVEGGDPDILEATERDRILAMLIDSLYQAPDDLIEQTTGEDGATHAQPLRISAWVKALEAVEDSVKTRKSSSPGSRNYLNFVQGFIRQANGIE